MLCPISGTSLRLFTPLRSSDRLNLFSPNVRTSMAPLRFCAFFVEWNSPAVRSTILYGSKGLSHTSEVVGDQHLKKWWVSLGDQKFQKHHLLFNLTVL